jgi:hypothetical protein
VNISVFVLACTLFFPNTEPVREIDVNGLKYNRQIDIKRVQYTNPERNTFLFMASHEVFEVSLEDGSTELIFSNVEQEDDRPKIQSFAYIPPRWDFGDYPDGFYLISTYHPRAKKAEDRRRFCLVGRKSVDEPPSLHGYFKAPINGGLTEDVSFSRVVSTGEKIFVGEVADKNLVDLTDWEIREISIREEDGALFLSYKGLPFSRSNNNLRSWLSNFRLFWAIEDPRPGKDTGLLAIGELSTVINGIAENETYYSSTEAKKRSAPFKTVEPISVKMTDYVSPYENAALKPNSRPWYYSFNRISGIYPAPYGRIVMGIQKPKPGYVWTTETVKAGPALEVSPFILSINWVDVASGEVDYSFDIHDQEFLIGFDGESEVYTLLQDPNQSPSFKIRVYQMPSSD